MDASSSPTGLSAARAEQLAAAEPVARFVQRQGDSVHKWMKQSPASSLAPTRCGFLVHIQQSGSQVGLWAAL